MNSADEIELAEHNERVARDRTVDVIRAELRSAGTVDCVDCGDEIEAARRAAMPSARRCVRCQGKVEREKSSCI